MPSRSSSWVEGFSSAQGARLAARQADKATDRCEMVDQLPPSSARLSAQAADGKPEGRQAAASQAKLSPSAAVRHGIDAAGAAAGLASDLRCLHVRMDFFCDP